jgi:hypothetical protein
MGHGVSASPTSTNTMRAAAAARPGTTSMRAASQSSPTSRPTRTGRRSSGDPCCRRRRTHCRRRQRQLRSVRPAGQSAGTGLRLPARTKARAICIAAATGLRSIAGCARSASHSARVPEGDPRRARALSPGCLSGLWWNAPAGSSPAGG